MRPPVPFIGEELIFRDEGDDGDGKRRGSIIDEVLSTAGEPSSWEDAVVPHKASGSVSIRKAAPTKRARPRNNTLPSTPVPPRINWVPINNGHGLRITISGIIDQDLREEWLRLLRDIAGQDIAQFELNLTKAPTVNLTGLAMLLLFREERRLQKQNIALCHCNREILELLRWTGMDRYFEIQGTEPEDKKAKP